MLGAATQEKLFGVLDLKGVSDSVVVTTDDGSSGVVVVLVDPTGERTMFPDNGANSGLHIGDLPDLTGFSAVYLSGYSPLDPLSRPGVLEMVEKIKSTGIPLYFDPASVGAMR